MYFLLLHKEYKECRANGLLAIRLGYICNQKWKAMLGPEKEVIFRQNHPPGWQGISNFTYADILGVSLRKEPFPHLFYHYRLSYSGVEFVQVVQGRESFSALAEGLQNAFWNTGGIPETDRIDSLSHLKNEIKLFTNPLPSC